MTQPCSEKEEITKLKSEQSHFSKALESIDGKQDRTISRINWAIGIVFGAIVLLAMNYGSYISDYKHLSKIVMKNSTIIAEREKGYV